MFVKPISILLICILHNLAVVNCGKYNVSYEMLGKCKEYDALVGYNYDSHFEIQELNHLRGSDDVLSLRLVVLAAKDAHILLSATDNPKSDETVIEIVLGAGANTFSEIRKKRKTGSLITVTTKKLLSVIDPLPLILSVKNSGLITVTIDGELMPLMSATLVPLFPIKYISFSSWGGTLAKWFYDCPTSTTESNSIDHVEKPMTNVEKLIIAIFTDYDSYKIPEELEEVVITSMTVKKVTYNIKKSLMETLVTLSMTWQDEKMAWDPSQYDNVTELRSHSIQHFYAWRPNLMLMNGIDLGFVDDLGLSINLYANGTFTGQSRPFMVKTFCSQEDTLRQWPSEKLLCDIVLAVGVRNISLVHDGTIGIDPLAEQSEWSLTSLTKATVQIDANDEILEKFDVNYDNEGDADYPSELKDDRKKLDISFRFYLERNQEFYEKVFFTPLVCAFILMLLSFWSTEKGRLALTLLSTVILALAFVFNTRHAPLSYVPVLMKYYQTSLILSWISQILVIIDIWLTNHPPVRGPPMFVTSTIGLSILRLALALERISVYDTLKQPEKAWTEVKRVVDRTVFLGYFLFFWYMLFAGY